VYNRCLLSKEGIQVGDVGLIRVGQAEELATQGKFGFAQAIDQEAVVTDSSELARLDVLEKSLDEVLGAQRHGFFLLVAVVEVTELNASPLDL
jgi:hypothetical protein